MNMNQIVGQADLMLITLDTLRYDVAQAAWQDGLLPNLSRLLPSTGWQLRHTPGNFTFAAHSAFFTGFFPTPAMPGKHFRPFALRFAGSETTGPDTCVLEGENLISGLANRGYHTICIGGVGFFNKQTPLGCVLPGMFHESHWSVELGVTDRDSTRNQVRVACDALARLPHEQRAFLFINISALHQPNCHYLPGHYEDNCATQMAALQYVDSQLPPLLDTLRARGNGWGIVCSDHGTAYGEEGYWGHRISHPVVWNVPYAEVTWEHQS
ncbi:STM4013/SEN3800 family hydrolase [Bremerella sp. JC817]|uniref:STM4013/SEN3800 family hydrolase n=1 Tax=Bremerella sp. JC817 TaxID=3231756 RepID=UPI0034596B00